MGDLMRKPTFFDYFDVYGMIAFIWIDAKLKEPFARFKVYYSWESNEYFVARFVRGRKGIFERLFLYIKKIIFRMG